MNNLIIAGFKIVLIMERIYRNLKDVRFFREKTIYVSRFSCLVLFFLFLMPGIGGARPISCGAIPKGNSADYKFMIETRLHEYEVTTLTFLDGWQKFGIIPLSFDAMQSYRRNESSIPFHIAQCLCGSNPRVNFLYRNKRSEFVYRYRCDTGSRANEYRARILSAQRVEK